MTIFISRVVSKTTKIEARVEIINVLIDIVFNRITYIYYLKIFLKLGTDEGSDERRWQSHLQGSIGH